MQEQKRMAEEVADFLKRRNVHAPRVGLLTGTGLGDSIDTMKIEAALDYKDIPYFPISTVAGHRGKLAYGRIEDHSVVAMQGRFHLYEGYSPREVTFPVRVMQELGVQVLIVTNAAGGLNPDFQPGDLMCITDHINLTGENPLVGPNEDAWGIRFPDMCAVYDSGLIHRAEKAYGKRSRPIQKGVYTGLKGPSLETPAEVRYLRQIGTDAVGLSTIQEVIAGVHARMRILGLSIITNVNDPDSPVPATVEEIIAVAEAAAPRLAATIQGILTGEDL
jgi:purine-nucleoside phosphorylase